MQHSTVTGPRPVRRVLSLLGGAFTAAILLSVPALALSSVASWGRGPSAAEEGRPPIAASDDAVANGFRIVAGPATDEVVKAAPATADPAQAETLLRDWQFMRGPPSQGG